MFVRSDTISLDEYSILFYSILFYSILFYSNVEGSKPRGKPRKTWIDEVKEDMRLRGSMREDANDEEKWRRLS